MVRLWLPQLLRRPQSSREGSHHGPIPFGSFHCHATIIAHVQSQSDNQIVALVLPVTDSLDRLPLYSSKARSQATVERLTASNFQRLTSSAPCILIRCCTYSGECIRVTNCVRKQGDHLLMATPAGNAHVSETRCKLKDLDGVNFCPGVGTVSLTIRAYSTLPPAITSNLSKVRREV